MAHVFVKPGMPIDRALKKLKRKLEAEGFQEEIRKRRFFMTRKQRRRLEKKCCTRRIKKERQDNEA